MCNLLSFPTSNFLMRAGSNTVRLASSIPNCPNSLNPHVNNSPSADSRAAQEINVKSVEGRKEMRYTYLILQPSDEPHMPRDVFYVLPALL